MKRKKKKKTANVTIYFSFTFVVHSLHNFYFSLFNLFKLICCVTKYHSTLALGNISLWFQLVHEKLFGHTVTHVAWYVWVSKKKKINEKELQWSIFIW